MRRMVTVSSGIFVGVDIADAAVRSIASRDPVKFFLRVNYVGIATFTVACVVDVRAMLENESLPPERTRKRNTSAVSRTLDVSSWTSCRPEFSTR